MGAYSLLDLITRTSFTHWRIQAWTVVQTLIPYKEPRKVFVCAYCTILSRFWVFEITQEKIHLLHHESVWLIHSHQRESWIHDREKETRKEQQTYFCAEIDGRSVFCSVLENSFYCWDWSQICCVGSPSDLQVILWKQERLFYGEIVLLNNEKSRNSFF